MIGFECPWCEQEVGLSPQGFADEAFVCTECDTHVELSVSPASQISLVRSSTVGLPLAA